MQKIIKHIRRWNIWRKNNTNGWSYKFLVLIGLVDSPTMMLTLLPEEQFTTDFRINKEFYDAYDDDRR